MKARFGALFMVLLFNIVGFSLLYFFTEGEEVKLLFVMGIMCALIIGMYVSINIFKLGDPYPFLIVAMLVSLSVVILYSLGVKQLSVYDIDFLEKKGKVILMGKADAQLRWFVVGIVMFFAGYFAYVFHDKWNKYVPFYVVASVCLYIISLVGPFKSPVSGVHNWVNIFGISLQVSEFIKLCYCFTMASFFSRKTKLEGFAKKLYGIDKTDIMTALFIYLCLGFFVIQGELGTALLFFAVYFALMVLYCVPLVIPFANIALVVVGILGLYVIGKIDYVMDRIDVWLDPYTDRWGTGYQIIESLKLIATGGFFGTGLCNSSAYALSVAESDFIFAAICGEMGIFMGFGVIMLYFMFAYRGYKIAIEVKEPFDKALALTLVTTIAAQACIIIGGVTKMIPLTGIPLPFVSSGGSSIIVSFTMLGILTAISSKKEKSALIVDKK